MFHISFNGQQSSFDLRLWFFPVTNDKQHIQTDLQIEQANRLSGRYIRDSLAYVCAHINRRSNLQVIRIRLKFGRHCKSLWRSAAS